MSEHTHYTVHIIGGGLAGSEAALQLVQRGIDVVLFEMRPVFSTEVHVSDSFAELVCSNSLKSTKKESAAGMLKHELSALGSKVLGSAYKNSVDAGGALAVDRSLFSQDITERIYNDPHITVVRGRVDDFTADGTPVAVDDKGVIEPTWGHPDAIILATGPLTTSALSSFIQSLTGEDQLAFYDAAAPIVLADSLDRNVIFKQSRYEKDAPGDYLNAPFNKEQYEYFIHELIDAKRVILKDFETKDLFQACQPIEEIARKGLDAPRFGAMKPVGLEDPATGHRPWAAVQLRAEDTYGQSYNLVGFQTNLTFTEQERVFRLIPGLEQARFTRFGVMHRNTFVDAPHTLDCHLRLTEVPAGFPPVFIAGQLSGTEGYCEAVMSGLYASLCAASALEGVDVPTPPTQTAFGSLLAYATDEQTTGYQPMHVNFGILPPLSDHIRNKGQRYAAYAKRGHEAMQAYCSALCALGLLSVVEERD